MSNEIHRFVRALLTTRGRMLCGVEGSSVSAMELIPVVHQWSQALGREFSEVLRGFEPSLRQSVLMTLIPAAALESDYQGSFDAAIVDHLEEMGLALSADEIAVLRNLIVNIRRFRGLNSTQARARTASLATVKGSPAYLELRKHQGERCVWCGVSLNDPNVVETLEHVVPKHMGDDPADGSNWALACLSCNQGKGDSLAWSANQWASDYMTRTQFEDPHLLEREHRWTVLRRTPYCAFCGSGPGKAELAVFRRVRTGLAIPSNCSVVCSHCASEKSIECLTVRWATAESDRR